jgi:hypothetical protein
LEKADNEELMHLFGNLDVLSFFRIKWLNWIAYINRMDSEKKTDGIFECKQILRHSKLQIVKRGKKTELAVRSPLRRRRCALRCSAM